jgi:hypothetical protein
MLQRFGRNCYGRLENLHNNALQARQVVPSTPYACRAKPTLGTHFFQSKAVGAYSIHRRNMRSMSKAKTWKSSLSRPTSTTRSSSAVVRNPNRHNWLMPFPRPRSGSTLQRLYSHPPRNKFRSDRTHCKQIVLPRHYVTWKQLVILISSSITTIVSANKYCSRSARLGKSMLGGVCPNKSSRSM